MEKIDIVHYLMNCHMYCAVNTENLAYLDAIETHPLNLYADRNFSSSIGYIELTVDASVKFSMESPNWSVKGDFVSTMNSELLSVKHLPGNAKFCVKDSRVTAIFEFEVGEPIEIIYKITLFLEAISNIILIIENEIAIAKAKSKLASLNTNNSH